jgi:uncharacterized protein (UPF0276 family)
MIFSPALRPFLERRPQALDLLEFEPQTLWLADDPITGPFREFGPGVADFAALPGHKLVHSVGIPLGGTRPPDPGQMALIRDTAQRLDSPWVSEHLSVAGTPHRQAGFLLPPLQTDAGVEMAVRNIRAFAAAIGRPVAVETGVAYFRRKPFEMEDGTFLARVVQEADCGLLLDLHNLYCNHRNGRIDFDRTLAQLPLDRVWEVHLAGGDDRDGVWLDSHSGPMPDDLAARAQEVISALPNLGAVNFEIYDSFFDDLDLATFDRITGQMREMWDRAGHARSDARPADLPAAPGATKAADDTPLPETWEATLTRSVWQDAPDLHPWPADHPGLRLYAYLARSFRGSLLARALPRTIRYALLRDGVAVDARLRRYFDAVAPQIYAPLEAEAFSDWCRAQGEDDPLMLALMEYDLAFLRLLRDSTPRVVRFPGNPAPVFEALAEARMPDPPQPPEWEFEILPDAVTENAFAAGPS